MYDDCMMALCTWCTCTVLCCSQFMCVSSLWMPCKLRSALCMNATIEEQDRTGQDRTGQDRTGHSNVNMILAWHHTASYILFYVSSFSPCQPHSSLPPLACSLTASSIAHGLLCLSGWMDPLWRGIVRPLSFSPLRLRHLSYRISHTHSRQQDCPPSLSLSFSVQSVSPNDARPATHPRSASSHPSIQHQHRLQQQNVLIYITIIIHARRLVRPRFSDGPPRPVRLGRARTRRLGMQHLARHLLPVLRQRPRQCERQTPRHHVPQRIGRAR